MWRRIGSGLRFYERFTGLTPHRPFFASESAMVRLPHETRWDTLRQEITHFRATPQNCINGDAVVGTNSTQTRGGKGGIMRDLWELIFDWECLEALIHIPVS